MVATATDFDDNTSEAQSLKTEERERREARKRMCELEIESAVPLDGPRVRGLRVQAGFAVCGIA